MKKDNKMDELDKHIPDDFWRKAFDEASETPPPRVWASIERQLDESNGPKVIPLWSTGLVTSQPAIWWGTGIAATLALLFVGWWSMNTQSTAPLTRIQASHSTENVASAPATSPNLAVPKLSDQGTESAKENSHSRQTSAQPLVASAQQALTRTNRKSANGVVAQTTLTQALKANSVLATKTMVAGNTPALRTSSARSAIDATLPAADRMAVASFTSARSIAEPEIREKQADVLAFESLTGKPLRLRSLGPIQRIVWFQPAELALAPELVKEKRKSKEKWASVSVMPGAFNPTVSLQSGITNPSIANTRTNQSAVSSRANFSVAYQAGAGMQLTDRWSVESGIGYLAGHSTVEAPTQASSVAYNQGISAEKNVVVNNLYVDALRNSITNKGVNAASPSNSDLLGNNNYLTQTSYSGQGRQTLTNDYQYMQVPVQVGYQLRPRKRLSLAVLGGLVTNIFVRNTVGNDVVINTKDGVYRPVSLAATMGARFRYRPSGRWSASLAGLYQPSLESGTRTESQVQSRPTSTGMSFGLDYHF